MPLPKNFDRRGFRTVALERASLNEETRSIELAFSSEAPVERSWGIEVLGHAEGEMDQAWIGGGTAPLLLDHNPREQVGVVEGVTLGEDRKARAVVRFGRSARAEEVMRDVADGIRTNVSVGYELLDIREEPAKKGEPQTYRAVRWRPLEVSLVSIPADMTVGVGREAPASVLPQPKTQETGMTPDQIEAPAPRANDEALEARRQKEIMDLATLANVRDMGVNAVLNGDTVELFRGKVLLARQGEAKPLGVAPAQLDMTPKEVARYSVFRAMKAAAENDWSEAGLEMEAHKELAKRFNGQRGKRSFFVPLDIQKRDLSAVTASAGGRLVATDNMSFIDILRARSVAMRMGATSMSGLVGNVTVPTQTGAATAAWLANETTAASESDQTFGQMALSPKNVAAYTEISRQLMLQSSPSAEMIVMNDLAAVVALAVDSAAINGSGASGQPLGIVGTAGIGSVTGTTLAYSGVLEFQTDVLGANALVNPASAGYVSTPAVAALLAGRSRFTNTDTPLWQGNLLDGNVAGFRAMTSTQIAAGRMLFGDFSQLVIGEWGALELDVNPYANFPAGITGVRAFYTVDIGVRYAAAFSYSTAIT
ncbi:MAG: phage major capsid protein [bacterium]|jgi:HK97 family phage major capsid protein